MMRWLTSAPLVVWVLCFGSVAAAQTDATLEGEARALFEAGASAFEGARYEEAMRYFQRSYELSGRPALLYNIGTAAERAREDELALRSYEEFLERTPQTERRGQVETRIGFLRRQLGRSEPAAASGGADFAPWILVGAGAAVAIAGGVLLGLGMADKDAVENAPPDTMWIEGPEQAYERGPALFTSGWVLLPLGSALAIGGIVWALVAPSGGETLSLRIGPGSIALSGEF